MHDPPAATPFRRAEIADLNALSYCMWTELLNSSQSASPLGRGLEIPCAMQTPSTFSFKETDSGRPGSLDEPMQNWEEGPNFPGQVLCSCMWLLSSHQLAGLSLPQLRHAMLTGSFCSGLLAILVLSLCCFLGVVTSESLREPDTQSHPGIKTTPTNRALTPAFC